MIAGRLELEFSTNLARITSEIQQINRVIGSNMQAVERSVGAAKSALQALGVGLSVGALVAFAKSVIDNGDALNKMSQKVGIAVEDLSRLQYAAKLSDVSTEALGKGLKTLAGTLVEAGDKSSKSGRLFAAMGVDISGGPMKVLPRLADVFSQLADSEVKTELATRLFGKAGMDLIPLLNQGQAGLKKLYEEAERLGIVMSGETAKAMEEFNDNLTTVKVSATAMAQSMFNDLAPSLKRITSAMKEAAVDAGIFKALLVGIGGIMAEWVGLNMGPLEKAQKHLHDLREELEGLRSLDKVGAILPGERGRIAELEREVQQAERLLEIQRKLANTQRGAADNGFVGPPVPSDLQQRIAKELAEGERRAAEARKAAAEAARILAQADGDLAKARIALDLATEESVGSMKKLTASERELLTLRNDPNFAKYPKQKQDEIRATLATAAAVERETATKEELLRIQIQLNAIDRETQDEIDALNNAGGERVLRLQEEVDLMTVEIGVMGKSNVERELAILQYQRLVALKGVANEADRQGINLKFDELAALVRQRSELQQQISVWTEVSDVAGRFFSDLITDGRKAFDNLKKMLKSLLADIISIFARRWILQLGASALGGTAGAALAGQAGQIGVGTVAGAGANFLGGLVGSGLTAAGGFFGGGFGSGLAMTGQVGIIPGFLNGAGALFSGGGMASFGAMLPAIGLAIVAIGLIASLFKDADKWRATLGFGANAQVYATDGVFGREGFSSIEGDDRVNRAIQDFMASTRPIDEAIARHLTPEQIAQITASLAAYNQRTDGQAAEFAFDRDEEGAAGQLTLEYLKHKYGTIFDTIDETFAEFIRNYTGSTEDLLREIGTFAEMMGQLSAMGIPGLDIATLRGLQRAGEQIGDTFQRISGQWATFTDLFTTDAERLTMAQEMVAEVFGRFNAEIPATAEEFEALVRGLLDAGLVGDEFTQALLEIAPVFHLVASAAEEAANAALERWQRVEGLIRRRNGITDFDHAVSQFQSGNSWAAGLSPQQLVQALLTITRPDFDRYTEANQDLIESILGLDDATEDAAESIARMGNSARGVFDPRPDVDGDAWRAGRAGVGSWLDSLLVGEGSPLNPMDQLAEAERQFRAAVAGGNGELIRSTGQAWIDLGRDLYRSGSRAEDIFQMVFDAAAGFAGAPDYNSRMLAISEQSNTSLMNIYGEQQKTNIILDKIVTAVEEKRQVVKAEPALGKR